MVLDQRAASVGFHARMLPADRACELVAAGDQGCRVTERRAVSCGAWRSRAPSSMDPAIVIAADRWPDSERDRSPPARRRRPRNSRPVVSHEMRRSALRTMLRQRRRHLRERVLSAPRTRQCERTDLPNMSPDGRQRGRLAS